MKTKLEVVKYTFTATENDFLYYSYSIECFKVETSLVVHIYAGAEIIKRLRFKNNHLLNASEAEGVLKSFIRGAYSGIN